MQDSTPPGPARKILTLFSALVLAVVVLLAGPLLRIAADSGVMAQDWRSASTAPAGWAPAPEDYEPAVVQAYAARAVRWRGAFAYHTWIAAKPAGAPQYRRYEVIGFRLRRTGSAVVVTDTPTPDRAWYGSDPVLLRDIRGEEAEQIIAKLPAAVDSYPYAATYRAWPGPNSNTFVAHVAREIPEMKLALPGIAIGKDFTGWEVVASAPSGTGFQISLGGLLGITLAAREGLEVNILGLVFGANPLTPALTVPGFGRLPARNDWTGGGMTGNN